MEVTENSKETINFLQQVTMDGKLTNDEIRELANWLNHHQASCHCWPGELLVKPLEKAIGDGVLEYQEIIELAEIISGIEKEWSGLNANTEAIERNYDIYSLLDDPMSKLKIPTAKLIKAVSATTASSNEERKCFVDLSEQTCTCKDFKALNCYQDIGNPGRFCRHMAKAILEGYKAGEIKLNDHARCLITDAANRGAGIDPSNEYAIITINCDNQMTYLLISSFSDWAIASTIKDGSFVRYGYNAKENRWAYKMIPPGSNVLEKAFPSIWPKLLKY